MTDLAAFEALNKGDKILNNHWTNFIKWFIVLSLSLPVKVKSDVLSISCQQDYHELDFTCNWEHFVIYKVTDMPGRGLWMIFQYRFR